MIGVQKKMVDGKQFNQREIWLSNFVFSNLEESKVRPILILSNKKYSDNLGILTMAISSKLNNTENFVIIEDKDLEKGFIKFKSKVKHTDILKIDKNVFIKKLGKLNIEKFEEIIKKLKFEIKLEN